MRRTVLLGPLLATVLALPGCVGFNDFLDNTTSYGTNPNMPMGDALNMRRVQGQSAEAAPIVPQDGNVWPKGVEAMPTLQDIEGDRPATPRAPAGMPTGPRTGQSSGLPVSPAPASPQAAVAIPSAPPPAPLAAAPVPPQTVIPTSTGLANVTTGTDRYQTVSTPTGTAVVVPNGNGTATLMRSDGTMETVTVPR